MIGSDFDSFEDFRDACREHFEPLNPAKILSKVYSIDQVRSIAEKANVNIVKNDDDDEEFQRAGVGKRYEYSESVGEKIGSERLGETLSLVDHELHFQYLSYARLTDAREYSSLQHFLSNLRNRNIPLETDFLQIFNGLTQPAGGNCLLESVLVPEGGNQISMVYSCTRVLTLPDSTQYSFENFFLARIPLIVRFFLDRKLVEFSMPFHSEPVAGSFNRDNKIPKRFQTMVDSAVYHLRNSLGLTFGIVNFDNFTLYLETHQGAEDMGWKIAPQDEAAFDLKQMVVPLRDILDSFTTNLNQEIQRRRVTHPLSDINLYEVFRALKEQSYTQLLVLKVPYGNRGGTVLLTVIYGHQGSIYLPLVAINKNKKIISDNIRNFICDSQTINIENPYNLDSLLSNKL